MFYSSSNLKNNCSVLVPVVLFVYDNFKGNIDSSSDFVWNWSDAFVRSEFNPSIIHVLF